MTLPYSFYCPSPLFIMDRNISHFSSVDMDLIVDEIMKNGSFTLKTNKLKILFSLLPGSLGSTFFGALLLYLEFPFAWLILLFPLFLLVLAKFTLFPNTLTLTPEGFTIKSRFRTVSHKWADVEEFKPQWTYFMRTIMYKVSTSNKSRSAVEKIGRSFSFGLYIFQDLYIMKAEDLAALMNKLRQNDNRSTSI